MRIWSCMNSFIATRFLLPLLKQLLHLLSSNRKWIISSSIPYWPWISPHLHPSSLSLLLPSFIRFSLWRWESQAAQIRVCIASRGISQPWDVYTKKKTAEKCMAKQNKPCSEWISYDFEWSQECIGGLTKNERASVTEKNGEQERWKQAERKSVWERQKLYKQRSTAIMIKSGLKREYVKKGRERKKRKAVRGLIFSHYCSAKKLLMPLTVHWGH